MTIKIKLFYVFSIAVILLASTVSIAYSNDYTIQDASPDDYSIFSFANGPKNEFNLIDYLDSIDLETGQTSLDNIIRIIPDIDPKDIVLFLIDEANALEILQEDFYLHTNRLVRRNLLDNPLFCTNRCTYSGHRTLGVHTFYTQTSRSNFTFNSTNLSSYIALESPTLIEKIQSAIDNLRPLFADPGLNLDIRRILNLFTTMTIQTRQAGFMVHFLQESEDGLFRIFTPIHYFERNFFLTDAERRAVEEEFGTLEPEEQEAFQKAHFINDKIGMGDTRIEFDRVISQKPRSTIHCGARLTLPTAYTLGEGFRGSSFAMPSTFPTFSFAQLFQLAQNPTPENQEKAFEIISNTFLGALDRLAANLLDVKMGNGGHIGIGAYVNIDHKLNWEIDNPRLTYTGMTHYCALEFLLPATEKRFFINKIDTQEFKRSNFITRAEDNPTKACDNLAFLEEKFIERIYLRAFDVRVTPLFNLRWVTKLCYEREKIALNGGFDIWVQGPERVNIDMGVMKSAANKIDTEKVIPPIAHAVKLFGTIAGSHKADTRTWYFSLNGTGTLFKRGIGADWGLTFNVEAAF